MSTSPYGARRSPYGKPSPDQDPFADPFTDSVSEPFSESPAQDETEMLSTEQLRDFVMGEILEGHDLAKADYPAFQLVIMIIGGFASLIIVPGTLKLTFDYINGDLRGGIPELMVWWVLATILTPLVIRSVRIVNREKKKESGMVIFNDMVACKYVRTDGKEIFRVVCENGDLDYFIIDPAGGEPKHLSIKGAAPLVEAGVLL